MQHAIDSGKGAMSDGEVTMRVGVYVRPRASRSAVGGQHDGELVVAVTEPPEAGRATKGVLRGLSDALNVPASRLTLVAGATSRHKIVELRLHARDAPRVRGLLEALRSEGPA